MMDVSCRVKVDSSQSKFKKAQAILEYSLFIAALVAGLLFTQAYLKRGMQGQMQLSSDQLSDPYDYGSTQLHEHSQSDVKTVNWALPAPLNKIRTRGTYSFNSQKELKTER